MSPAVRIGAVVAILLAVLAVIVFVALEDPTLPDGAPSTERPAAQRAEPSPPREPTKRRRSTDAPVETDLDTPTTTEHAAIDRGVLVIHVVDTDGKPIAGARVVAEDAESVSHECVTGTDGTAKFAPPIDSDYARIAVTAEGHASARHFADKQRMRDGGTFEIALPDGVSIDGVVLESGTGHTISGAAVKALTVLDDVFAETTTAANGAFRLDDLPGGDALMLRFEEPHHVARSQRWDARSETRIEVRLDRAGLVRGLVTLPGGEPEPWARVTASCFVEDREDRRAQATTYADAKGVYALGGLPMCGEWVLVASKPGLGDSEPSERIRLTATNTDAVADLTLRRPLALEVHVLHPDGTPAKGARVAVHTSAGYGSPLMCDANGVRRLDVFDSTLCSVTAWAEGFPSRDFGIDPTPGRVIVLEARLEPGAAISGVVVDDAGTPVVRAEVSARSPGAPSWPADHTGDHGEFRIDGVPPGKCVLVASAVAHAPGTPTPVTSPASDVRLVVSRRGNIPLRFARGHAAGFRKFSVRLVSPDGRHDEQDVDPAYGRANLLCDPGEWRMVLSAPGFAPLAREFRVVAGEDAVVGELSPETGSTLIGRVADVNGVPVAGARLELAARPVWMLLGETVTDATGAFSMEHVPAGSARLDVMHPDFLPFGKEFAFGSVAGRLEVTLRKAGTLAGTLREGGEPVPLGRIRATFAGDDQKEPELTTTGTDGTFRMKLRPGRWRLAIARATGEDVTYDVDVKDGATTTVDLTR